MLCTRGLDKKITVEKSYPSIQYAATVPGGQLYFLDFITTRMVCNGSDITGRGFGEVGYCGEKLVRVSFPPGKRKTTKGSRQICTPLRKPSGPDFSTREFTI